MVRAIGYISSDAATLLLSCFAGATSEARIATLRVLSNWRKRFEEGDMTRHTSRWDAADSLETKEDIAAYLDAVLEDGDPDLLKALLSKLFGRGKYRIQVDRCMIVLDRGAPVACMLPAERN